MAVWTKLILLKCTNPLPHCQLVSWVVAFYFRLVEVHSASAKKEEKNINVQFKKISLIPHRRVWNYTTYMSMLSRSVISKQCQLQSSIGKTDIVTNALMFLFDRLQITNMYKVKHQLFQSQIMQFLLMEWLATTQHFMCQCSNGIIKSPSLPISFTTFLHVDLNSLHSLPF